MSTVQGFLAGSLFVVAFVRLVLGDVVDGVLGLLFACLFVVSAHSANRVRVLEAQIKRGGE